MKRPAFQFYPSDWRKDMALQSCSIAARGLWIDLMCIAHECEPYGHLSVNGKPMNAAQIARHVGITPRECERLLAELADAGVSSVTDDGVIYSRRMVRDEQIRVARAEGGQAGAGHGHKGAEHGKKGGRPRKQTGVEKPPFQPPSEPPKEPPPSSSSSSSSSNTPQPPEGEDGFARFWDAWPSNRRKAAKDQCRRKWVSQACAPLADAICAAVEASKALPEWSKNGGEFIPAPLVWLNQRRWEAFTDSDTATGSLFEGAV